MDRVFNRWKVPSRILDTDRPRARPVARRGPRPVLRCTPTALPSISSRTSSSVLLTPVPSSQFPKVTRSARGPLRRSAQSTPIAPVPRARSVDSTAHLKEDLRASLRPQAVNQAEEWMRKAPGVERQLIERLLRGQQTKVKSALSKTLLPDAKKSVEHWLLTATESERQVALGFFNSLAGSQLVGTSAEEQRSRLRQVVATLESSRGQGRPQAVPARVESRTDDNCRLQFIKLMDPETRSKRWQETTWHHLPVYDTDMVQNVSSHYTLPHAPIPRHFVIHPDWG